MCQTLAVSTYDSWGLPATHTILPGPLSLQTHLGGQMMVVMTGSSSLGVCGGDPQGLSGETSGWLSRSSRFLLKTLGLSPPTVLWPLTAFCNELWGP